MNFPPRPPSGCSIPQPVDIRPLIARVVGELPLSEQGVREARAALLRVYVDDQRREGIGASVSP